MQQHNKNVYVTKLSGEKLYYGKCLMQQITKNGFQVPLEVYFDYDRDKGHCIINKSGSKPSIHLLHAKFCPCEEKIFESLNPKQISFAVVSIVQDSLNNFLLTRRNSQMRAFPQAWVFPGGMVDQGGELEKEVLRELQEETGINQCQVQTCKPLVLYGISILNIFIKESVYPTVLDDYPKKHTLILFFVVTLNYNKEDIILQLCQEEVDKHQWIEHEDMIGIVNCKGQKYPELMGVYPNNIGQGIGEGHLLALQYMFDNQ